MILLERLFLFRSGGILGWCQINVVVVMLVVGLLVAVAGFGVWLGWFSYDVGIRSSCNSC